MKPVVFEIPGMPVGKQRPKFSRQGGFVRAYTPEKTISYEALVASSAQQALASFPDWDFEAAYSVTIVVNVPIPASWSKKRQAEAKNMAFLPTKMPDIDNVVKSIFDGMNGVIWKDDKQVVSVVAGKKYAQMPSVKVTVDNMGKAA